jgi:two-component system, LytTR family, sensor kinase
MNGNQISTNGKKACFNHSLKKMNSLLNKFNQCWCNTVKFEKKKMTNRQTNFILHIGFWILIELIFVWLFAIIFDFKETVIVVTTNILLLVVLFYGHTEAVNRFLERKKTGVFVAFSLLSLIVLTYLRVHLSDWLVGRYIPDGKMFFFTRYQRLIFFEVFTSVLTAVTAVFYQLLQNRYQRERQNQALIFEQQAAQLQFLKAQINPHFLFNALNNVYSLTLAKSDEAPKMLLKLSDLLRYVIYEGRENAVLLAKEVAGIRKFIDLFQMKNEHPLPISIEVDGNLNDKTIEPMILLPLVENCFKHCNFERDDTAFTKIKLSISASNLIFFTQNTFDKNDGQKDKIGGVGLKNIQHRLSLRYPDQHHFSHTVEDNIFEVLLKIQF